MSERVIIHFEKCNEFTQESSKYQQDAFKMQFIIYNT